MPECRDGKLQPKMICPHCKSHGTVTKTGQFFQCCGKHGGCGFGGMAEEFNVQVKLIA